MRDYYNPGLSPADAEALDLHNVAVLAAVQAALGNISDQVLAIFVHGPATAATLHFVVVAGADAVEDVEDVVSEFAATYWPPLDLSASAVVHRQEIPRSWRELGWTPIYWAKGWSALQEPREPRS